MSTRSSSGQTSVPSADSPRPRRRRRWIWALAAIPLLAASAIGASWWRARIASEHVRSLAVLPFFDSTRGDGLDWFGEGLTCEIIDDLSRVPALRVAARTSAFTFAEAPRDLLAIGRQLGVAAVLEGNIRVSEGRLRATLDLHRTEDGYQLWTADVERPIDDVFGLEQAVVLALEHRIGAAPPRTAGLREPQAKAYDAYLEGRAQLSLTDAASMQRAAERFVKATELDPRFALAWAWQSVALEYQADTAGVRPNEAMAAARDAAERAVALDNDSAAAHLALGMVKLQYDWDWRGAKDEFDHALQLNPGSAYTQHWLAHWYETQGKLADAMHVMAGALALDPLSPEMLRDIVAEHLASSDPAGALPFAKQAAELQPHMRHAQAELALALGAAGHVDEGRRLCSTLQAAPDGEQPPSVESAMCAALGDPAKVDEARALLDQGEDLHSDLHVPSVALARLAAALGDQDSAFQWLERAWDERSVQLPYARLDPRMAKTDPRFLDLLDRMNLPR